MAKLNWGSATHTGQIRAQNEDNLVAVDGVFVVADGMGGHEAGEVASQIAVDRIRADLDVQGLPEASAVVDSISNANGDIFRAAIANPGQAGMGTTVTAIAVISDNLAGRGVPNLDVNDDGKMTPIRAAEPSEALVLANVGDSRTYLLRHGRLRRVTIDHSYVQELVSTGHITEEEARTHPRRNIITRALGIEPDVKVDWWTLPLIRGDRFLLCSDGLVDEVADPDILETITTLTDPQEAADRLVDQANEAGGRDNITVIVVDVLEGDDPPDPTLEIDVVPLWADDVDPTPAGSLSIDADSSANGLDAATGELVEDDKKSDRGPKRFILAMVLA
ncbi:MAG: serine/threonine protein phosphatase PrpC, partial [Minisyncoccia bacterium]